MRRILTALLALLSVIYSAQNAAAETDISVSARECVLIDASSGRLLWKYGSDEPMLIASTTKIMTALVVSENCSPEEDVLILPEYTGVEGSSMYLKINEILTVRELLYGLLLQSGNDAAKALACHTAGSIEDFAKLMNEKADRLGLKHTHFVNPHGLDAQDHYSCAYDLAIISAEFMRVKLLADITATKYANIAGRSMKNHNKLLWEYEGTMGLKTGYTEHAGRSLVSCVRRGGLSLICVTLNDPDDWNDHKKLFDWGFGLYKSKTLLSRDTEFACIPVISGISDKTAVRPSTEVSVALCETDAVEYKLNLPHFVYAPVKKSDIVGSVDIIINGEELFSVELLAFNDVPADKKIRLSLWEQIQRSFDLSVRYGFPGLGFYYY